MLRLDKLHTGSFEGHVLGIRDVSAEGALPGPSRAHPASSPDTRTRLYSTGDLDHIRDQKYVDVMGPCGIDSSVESEQIEDAGVSVLR